MASLEHLRNVIYHEKQARGSMLCAQHALNSLLQGHYFTAPDLSVIARGLDHLELSYDEGRRGRDSSNMDDTGFFSVQVLENALNVWNLTLVRWRSAEIKAYHDHPETQQAFILNQQQHWYTIRRFGSDPGHWYNLNSSLYVPMWVGHLYLGMFLQQAEEDGYSVFTIRSLVDPPEQNPLPPCEADEFASTMSASASLSTSTSGPAPAVHPSSHPAPNDPWPSSQPYTPASSSTDSNATSYQPQRQTMSEVHYDLMDVLTDEDIELQAALQASLLDRNGGGASQQFLPQHFFPPPPLHHITDHPSSQPSLAPPPLLRPLPEQDPLADSMARNRALLARVQQEQEQALREGCEEEQLRIEESFARAWQENNSRAGRAVNGGEDAVNYLADVDPSESTDNTPHGSLRSESKSRRHDAEDAAMEINAAGRPSSLSYANSGLDLEAIDSSSAGHPHHAESKVANSGAALTSVSQERPSQQVMVSNQNLSVDELRMRRLARFSSA